MLDNETKSRINTARDILVGKVPDPKSQVEQITIALIYKFMDDMDKEALEFGGERSFFVGEFEKYAWSNLFNLRMSGQEVLNLYGEALVKFPLNKNPDFPQLFRDIFKNAYLPYRDPETLKLFLKEINKFTYDHSERLGDAFEYLLSVMGSQGDAGQFRTPRNIIDFVVEILQPKKHETMLDPACGTAGFLISAYKHILKANTSQNNPQDGNLLTPDEKKRLIQNVRGYDISPDMVRLSLVNLYLHGFTNPQIYEYDSLTSDDRWNEYYDVILANPPFMTPKGGIKPHKRFSIQSNRAEVLFVDFIAEHLTPTGRAGIIVPEGIIFQAGTAYKSLRKMLIDKYLWAVVSLPAGIFNPYSGVKTSILLLDKTLAKHTDNVLFVKVQEDGFGLGAQRRSIEKNDLPTALNLLKKYQESIRSQQPTPFGDAVHDDMALVVSKAKIIENGDYNFSGDRYKVTLDKHNGIYDFVELQDVCEKITDGTHQTPTYVDEGVIFLSSKNVTSRKIDWDNVKYIPQELHQELSKRLKPQLNDVLLAKNGTTGVAAIVDRDEVFDIYVSLALLRATEKILPKYLLHIVNSDLVKQQFNSKLQGIGVPNLHLKEIKEVKIPLPPLSIQQEIVNEIEGYQKVIDGAKQVINAYKPHISIKKHWKMVELWEVCEIKRGRFSHRPRNAPQFYGGKFPFIQTGDIVKANGGKINYGQTLNELGLSVSKLFQPTIVLITVAANIGDTAILDYPACFPDSVVGLIPNVDINPYFLELIMRTKRQHLNDIAPQAAQKNINIEILKDVKIPLPPLSEQEEIVAAIEKEQSLVNANKELVAIMEAKIKAKIAEVWGESQEEKPTKTYQLSEEPLAMVAESTE